MREVGGEVEDGVGGWEVWVIGWERRRGGEGVFLACGMYGCIVGKGIGVGRGIEHRAWALSAICIGLPIYCIIWYTKGTAGLFCTR